MHDDILTCPISTAVLLNFHIPAEHGPYTYKLIAADEDTRRKTARSQVQKKRIFNIGTLASRSEEVAATEVTTN